LKVKEGNFLQKEKGEKKGKKRKKLIILFYSIVRFPEMFRF